jgi:hypothetical protein
MSRYKLFGIIVERWGRGAIAETAEHRKTNLPWRRRNAENSQGRRIGKQKTSPLMNADHMEEIAKIDGIAKHRRN